MAVASIQRLQLTPVKLDQDVVKNAHKLLVELEDDFFGGGRKRSGFSHRSGRSAVSDAASRASSIWSDKVKVKAIQPPARRQKELTEAAAVREEAKQVNSMKRSNSAKSTGSRKSEGMLFRSVKSMGSVKSTNSTKSNKAKMNFFPINPAHAWSSDTDEPRGDASGCSPLNHTRQMPGCPAQSYTSQGCTAQVEGCSTKGCATEASQGGGRGKETAQNGELASGAAVLQRAGTK